MNISLLASLGVGVLGVLGWIVAWRSRGATLDEREVADRVRGDLAVTRESEAANLRRAVAAEAELAAERVRATELEKQLAAERASAQSLADELAKAGVPVGDVLVDHSLDGLYQNGRDETGAGSG